MAKWENLVTHNEARFKTIEPEAKVQALYQMMPLSLWESRYCGQVGVDYITLKAQLEAWASAATDEHFGQKDQLPMRLKLVGAL